MQTRSYKDHYKNWIAKSVIMLSNTHELSITTSKRSSGKVCSYASVGHRNGNSVTHAVFSDFSRQYKAETYSRVTQKVVESQHSSLDFESIIAEAKEFYNLT